MNTTPDIALQFLLGCDEEEAQRWEEWLRKNPQALQVQIQPAETVRDCIFHLFTLQHCSAQRLLGERRRTRNSKRAQFRNCSTSGAPCAPSLGRHCRISLFKN